MRDRGSGTSWPVASCLLVSVALGAGVVNYPFAYDKAGGVYFAAFLQMLIVALLIGTMLILVHCADLNSDTTYHDVIFSMCGRRAQQCAALCIVVSCYGICITYLVIIGDQYDRIFFSLMENEFCSSWFLDRRFTISATAVVFILPISFFRRLDFLRYASWLGIFATLYPVFLTVYEYYHLDTRPEGVKIAPDSILQMIAVIPVFTFTYQTHEGLVSVYAGMAHRTIRNFGKSALAAMLFLFLMYCITGSFGYMTFGGSIAPDIMEQYGGQDPLVLVGLGALVIKMATTYPMIALCAREALDGIYSELRKLTSEQKARGERRRRVIVSSIWFVTSVLLAAFTPNIGILIELLGCLSSVNIFIFPGMCLIALSLRRDSKLRKKSARWYAQLACAIIMIAFGASVFVIVLIQVFGVDLTGEKTLKTYFECP